MLKSEECPRYGTFGAKIGTAWGKPEHLVTIVVQMTTWSALKCQRRTGSGPGPVQEMAFDACENLVLTVPGFLGYSFCTAGHGEVSHSG